VERELENTAPRFFSVIKHGGGSAGEDRGHPKVVRVSAFAVPSLLCFPRLFNLKFSM
jgi:hypothetical protein